MRVDSNTIEVPFDAIKHIDTTYLTHSQENKGGSIIKDLHRIKSNDLPFGISGIEINNIRKTARVETSAKILGADYLEGININTYSKWIDSINSLGIIELDKNSCFELGTFNKIDTTNNIDFTNLYDLDKDFNEVLGLLEVASLNDRFLVVPYNRKDNQGIEYRGNQKSEKNRLTMYRKYLDLRKSANKDFINSFKNPIAFLESTKNILRIEQNHTTFRSIRNRLETPSNKINEVLQNGKNPNLKMLDKITQPHRENQLLMVFNEYSPEHYDLETIVKLEGIKNLIRSANYCEKTLQNFIKRYAKDSMFRWWWYGGRESIPAFRPLIQELKIKDKNQDPQKNKVIDFIRIQLAQDKVA